MTALRREAMASRASPRDTTIRAETTGMGARGRGISSLTQIMVVTAPTIEQANSVEKSPENDMAADPAIARATPAPDLTSRHVIRSTTAEIIGSTKTEVVKIVLLATPETKEEVEAEIAMTGEVRHPENALARDPSSIRAHKQI